MLLVTERRRSRRLPGRDHMRAKRAIGQGHVLALRGVTPQAVLSSQPGNPARRGLRASGNRAPPHGGEASRGALPLFDCSLPLAAGPRWEAAYFVVTRRREACRLAPPQHGGARSGASDDDGGGFRARCAKQPRDSGRIGAGYSSSSSATARSTVATLPEVLASGWRPRR